VNVAARVEALAGGGDICLTREVHEAPDVQAILAPYPVSTGERAGSSAAGAKGPLQSLQADWIGSGAVVAMAL
jgi:class 3 adenylate cyclase